MPPYSCEIANFLKKGRNKLEIRVTNQWTNRLIGHQMAPSGKKTLNSGFFIFGRNLNESGLIGPVKISCNE